MRALAAILAISFCFLQAHAEPNYRRSKIADARFGTGERETLLAKARGFAASAKLLIKGQDAAGEVLQDRLVKYLEGFPNRKAEPIALNLVGLPGVGKSALVSRLRDLDIAVIHFDAQKYASQYSDFANDVSSAIIPYVSAGRPVVLVIEEIDKVPEFDSEGHEKTSGLIGALNQMISDGIVTRHGVITSVSNVFVVTTMNFSPLEIGSFTKDSLGKEKAVYDFTTEDFEAFDRWVKSSPGAIYKILSRLFRSNTVGRLAPNTLLMDPLRTEAYRSIVEMNVKETISRAVAGPSSEKRLSVEVDPSFIDFLAAEAVYPPSGARETVLRTDSLTDQLINIGAKVVDANDPQGNRPRKIRIAYNMHSKAAILTVTAQKRVAGILQDQTPQELTLAYSSSKRLFEEPGDFLTIKPPEKAKKSAFRVTQKMIYESRFPKSVDLTDGLVEKIDSQLLGQEEVSKIVQDDLNRYLGRQGPATKEPAYRVLAGFPGIGKSELVKIAAQHLGLEIVRVNMQQFSSDDAAAVNSFFEKINTEITRNPKIKDGKFIFVIEELDKVFEIDPQGKVKNRPIIAVIKDLLNEGFSSHVTQVGYNTEVKKIDIRSAFTFATMNFSIDRFGFSADPRLTTVDDVLAAWKKIKSTPMTIKSLLGSMFLPETVSRLMSRLSIMKPPNRAEYQQIIRNQVGRVAATRLKDAEGHNTSQIEIETTARYQDYLYRETVIPSEGARNTVMGAAGLLATDLEDALRSLPRSSEYARVPVVLTFDFDPRTTRVEVMIRKQGEPVSKRKAMAKQQEILQKEVALNFPSLEMTGKLPEKRLLVSAHEFGHAYIAQRLGIRFETIVVAAPNPEIGGYVKLRPGFSAQETMAYIYGLLGARAMERIFQSPNPRDPASVMAITAGASMDIKMASKSLFEMLFELGFDPQGGTVDRNFVIGPAKYADFASIPPAQAEKLGAALREMENEIVKDLLESETIDWYAERIVKLARKGAMSEKEFYALTGFARPANDKQSLGAESYLAKIFSKQVKNRDTDVRRAQNQKRGTFGETVTETMQRYTDTFLGILKRHFHESSDTASLGKVENSQIACADRLTKTSTLHSRKRPK